MTIFINRVTTFMILILHVKKKNLPVPLSQKHLRVGTRRTETRCGRRERRETARRHGAAARGDAAAAGRDDAEGKERW